MSFLTPEQEQKIQSKLSLNEDYLKKVLYKSKKKEYHTRSVKHSLVNDFK